MTKANEHLHAEFLRALADGEPLDTFEIHDTAWPSFHFLTVQPMHLGLLYAERDKWNIRRKQKTIRIGAMEIPEPMRVAPEVGAEYWMPAMRSSAVSNDCWCGVPTDMRRLNYGICHATREAAEAHRRALIMVSGGTP